MPMFNWPADEAKKICLAALESDGELLLHMPLYQDDRVMVKAAVWSPYYPDADMQPASFRYASAELKSDKAFIEDVLTMEECYPILKYVSRDFLSDRAWMTKVVVGTNGYALQYAHPHLQADRAFVVLALEKNEHGNHQNVLRWASLKLQNDTELQACIQPDRCRAKFAKKARARLDKHKANMRKWQAAVFAVITVQHIQKRVEVKCQDDCEADLADEPTDLSETEKAFYRMVWLKGRVSRDVSNSRAAKRSRPTEEE